MPATRPPWSWSRAFWIASWTSRSLSPSGAAASASWPAPFWTFSTTSGTWLTNGGITRPQSPRKTISARITETAAASDGGALRARSQRASGASSVASNSAMITGRTTTSIRLANSASRTIPPITMITRSVTAEATASPRGTASSPDQRGAGDDSGREPFPGSAAAGGTSSCAMASG